MLEFVDYNEWRRMRILYHGILSPYMKRQTTPDKLLPLPGDDELEEHNIEMTNQEKEVLRQRANALSNKMFNKK